MKKLLLLVFLLFVPFVAATSPPPAAVYNISLDDKLLDSFDLKLAQCIRFDDVIHIPKESTFIMLENDSTRNCTWFLFNRTECRSNPCGVQGFSYAKFYLQTNDSLIITEPFKMGEVYSYYNVYISSDGNVQFEFLRKMAREGPIPHRNLSLFRPTIMLFVLISTFIECIAAWWYFRKNSILYKNILWVAGVNIITFMLLTLLTNFTTSIGIVLLAIAVIILFEAFVYWLVIKELGWDRSITLSITTNLASTFVLVVLGFVFSFLLIL